MRIARFAAEGGVHWGAVVGEGADTVLEELEWPSMTGSPRPTGDRYPLDGVRLLAPVQPRTVVGFGRNYLEPGEPRIDGVPFLFLKPTTSVVGPGAPIPLPPDVGTVVHEAELAVVIGRTCRDVPADDAGEVILGYTCANDVTATDAGTVAGLPQLIVAKGYDGFCPLGPWIQTELDVADATITARVGDVERQRGTTADLRRGVAGLVAMTSRVMTLHPGDVLLTGTPAGSGRLEPGDVVEVSVEGIGRLRNPVVASDRSTGPRSHATGASA